jgi:hypothetical protein
MKFSPKTSDLIAFISVLLTGVLLIFLGVSPQSIAATALGMSTLYAAWHGHRPPSSALTVQPPGTRPDVAPDSSAGASADDEPTGAGRAGDTRTPHGSSTAVDDSNPGEE